MVLQLGGGGGFGRGGTTPLLKNVCYEMFTQDRDRWRTRVNGVTNLGSSIKRGEFLD